MSSVNRILLSSFLVFSFGHSQFANSIVLEKQTLKDSLVVGKKKLVLNGAMVRSVRRFMMNFKVYVGGMYVTKKTKSSDTVLASTEPVVIVQKYLRKIKAAKIKNGWMEGVGKNCSENCKPLEKGMKKFVNGVRDVKVGDTYQIEFYSDRVEVNFKGREETATSVVKDPKFSKFILKMFIGAKAPKEVREPLLGK